MARYAIVVAGNVTNIAEAEYALEANWIPCDGTAQIGGGYAPATGFIPPAVQQVSLEITAPVLSKVEVLRRITPTEWAQFNSAAQTNELLAYALAVFNAAPEVDTAAQLTQTLFAGLVQAGILTSTRVAEILA